MPFRACRPTRTGSWSSSWRWGVAREAQLWRTKRTISRSRVEVARGAPRVEPQTVPTRRSTAMPDWQESYPAVYSRIAPEDRALPQHQVESLLEGMFREGLGLAAAEGLFDDIG